MRSPFPGMDPYIEASRLWGDFHHDLIAEIKRALAQTAPDRYLVRTEERSYMVLVGSDGKDSHPFVPDVSITTPERGRKKTVRTKGATAVAEPAAIEEPITLRAFIEDEHRETFIEIFEATPEQRLETTIEVLSPSNKRPNSEGRSLYLRKRQSCLLGEANLVEIDLLRGGERMPMLDPWPTSPYTLMVVRAGRYQQCKVWPAHYSRRLPVIPVPLLKPDPDLTLDLQPMVEAIYQRSRYARSVDYGRPLTPPLSAEEAAWLEGRLRERQA